MKIEKNKFYKTRGSNKAKVYEIYGDKIHGAVMLNGHWRVREFYKDELIKEWTEKPTFNNWDDLPSWINAYVAMDEGGEWFAFSERPSAFKDGFITNLGVVAIRIPNHLTTPFNGDWRGSLIKNPNS